MKGDTKRDMYLQSFDINIVLKLCFMQKRWPVFLLTSQYQFEETRDFHNRIICFAHLFKYIGGRGFVIHDINVIDDTSLIRELKDMGFILQCWGSTNGNINSVVRYLDIGINGIITDTLEVTQETIDDYRGTYNID